MPLSKSFTAKIVADEIRNIAEEQNKSRLQPQDVIDYINLGVLRVFEKLDKNFYQTTYNLAVNSDSLDISALNVDSIIKIVDQTNGKLIKTGADEIENLTDNSRKQSNIYYYQEGETLRLYKGSNISTYGIMRLVYVRGLELCTKETDFLDVPDKLVPEVLEIAKNITYEKLNTATKKVDKEK